MPEHSKWEKTEWGRLVWSGESTIRYSTMGKVWVRRKNNERYKQECLASTQKHGGKNATVWECFSAMETGDLVRVEGMVASSMQRL